MFMAEPAEGMNPTGQWLYSGEGRVRLTGHIPGAGEGAQPDEK